jgi:hypothetical protein
MAQDVRRGQESGAAPPLPFPACDVAAAAAQLLVGGAGLPAHGLALGAAPLQAGQARRGFPVRARWQCTAIVMGRRFRHTLGLPFVSHE